MFHFFRKKSDAPKVMTMTMITYKSIGMFAMAGTGKVIIDWGDGKRKKVSLKKEFPEDSDDMERYAKRFFPFAEGVSRTIVIKGKNITHLMCFYMELTDLDVSKNTALTYLQCHGSGLRSLDVTKHTALKELYCGCNQLTDLDVTNNTALKELYCGCNQLTDLDVTNNTALTKLLCFDNKLTNLDLTKNIALEELNCSGNRLTSLDVTKNTKLKESELKYDNNPITRVQYGNYNEVKCKQCGKTFRYTDGDKERFDWPQKGICYDCSRTIKCKQCGNNFQYSDEEKEKYDWLKEGICTSCHNRNLEAENPGLAEVLARARAERETTTARIKAGTYSNIDMGKVLDDTLGRIKRGEY